MPSLRFLFLTMSYRKPSNINVKKTWNNMNTQIKFLSKKCRKCVSINNFAPKNIQLIGLWS